MTRLKCLLMIAIMIVLLSGSLQKHFGIFRSKPLAGFHVPADRPRFTMNEWMSGTYQEKLRISSDDSMAFRGWLVRLYNQLDYSLFGLANAQKIIAGREGYLFADNYLDAWLGNDFIGKPFIEDKVRCLKFIQDYLWNKDSILVLVVFTPSKGYFYPEHIPERFLKKRKEHRNHDYYVQQCREAGIRYIDFNEWFLRMKDTSRYVLYPKTGIHWSSYGSFLCADSLRRYLEVNLGRSLPRMETESVELSDTARDYDDDMDQTMNKIWKIPHPPMAYPRFRFVYDSVRPKPRALVIGDSFYWFWHRSGIIANTFANEQFWFYNWDRYPESFQTPSTVGSIDFKAALLQQDIIILLQTNGGFGEVGYGWIDMAYDYLYPGKTFTHDLEARMKADPSWLAGLAVKAKERNITLDYMMRLDAIFMKNHELRQKGKYQR